MWMRFVYRHTAFTLLPSLEIRQEHLGIKPIPGTASSIRNDPLADFDKPDSQSAAV